MASAYQLERENFPSLGKPYDETRVNGPDKLGDTPQTIPHQLRSTKPRDDLQRLLAEFLVSPQRGDRNRLAARPAQLALDQRLGKQIRLQCGHSARTTWICLCKTGGNFLAFNSQCLESYQKLVT